MDRRTSKRLSRALVLDRSIELLAQVKDEEQRQQPIHQNREHNRQDGPRRQGSTFELLDDNAAKPLQSIPPPDKGARAFLFMVSAFTIEAIMWGFPSTSAGVFTTYYNGQAPFQNDRFIAVIATLGTGIPFLGAPIITPLTARLHDYRQEMIWVGWVTCMGSLVAASFSTTVWQLIITQGLGYGIGFLVLYYAMLDMLNEWYVERRGLAYGVLFAAAGLSGTGLPFLTEYLLNKFAYAWTLRIYAVAILVLIGPTLPFCRGRIPPRSNSERKQRKIAYRRVLTNPIFYFFTFSNLFQGLVYFVPSIYLSLYAWSLNISTFPAVLLLCLLNLAQVIGQVATGYFSDVSSIFLLMTISTIGSVLACIFWFLAPSGSLAFLALFAVFYGMFAGGYSVFFSRFTSALTDDASTSLWLYGVFAFQRGLGNVAAGPLSALLLESTVHQTITNMPTGSVPVSGTMSASMASSQKALSVGFKHMIIFVGGFMLLAALGGIGWFWRKHVLPPRLSKSKSSSASGLSTVKEDPSSPDLSIYPSLEKRKAIWVKERTISVVTEVAARPSSGDPNSDWT